MNALKTLAKSVSIAAITTFGAIAATANADTFVIVHGAFQTADSWSAVAEALRANGHTAILVNLPGRNAEGAAAKAVTLASYVQSVEQVVQQQTRVTSTMVREPLGPVGTPVKVSAEKFGVVSKAYVRTAQDATISPTLQNMMIQRASIAQTQTVETEHSPQSTQPKKLADALVAMLR